MKEPYAWFARGGRIAKKNFSGTRIFLFDVLNLPKIYPSKTE